MALDRLQRIQSHLAAVPSGNGAFDAGLISRKPLSVTPPVSNSNTNGDNKSFNKVISAEQAVGLVKDGDWITISGFVGCGCPEMLLNALRARHDGTGQPSNLTICTPIVVGDKKGRGLDVLAKQGLISAMVYAWAGTTPELVGLIRENKIKAWNLPFGCVSQMIRDVGAGRLGPITKIGMGTYVDPRDTGGRKNALTDYDMVELVRVGGEQRLWYRAPKAIHVAFLRGTTADCDGNISFEKEALYLDQLNKAIAAHNSNGIVIVQVERVVDRGVLPTRMVHIPGSLVDKVVVAPPHLHRQNIGSDVYDPSVSGELRLPLTQGKALPIGPRRIIAHRAFFEIPKHGAVVNLGVGMPESLVGIVANYGDQNPYASSIVMTTEAGVMGGAPRGGLEFGTAQNAAAHMTCNTILDFYNGGGIDAAFLGMAEVDEEGNVNVSNFGPWRMPGCGGFIDISQSAKRVVFMGSHVSGGLKVSVHNGRLRVDEDGRDRKFCRKVREKTFAASSAGGRLVLYVTERAVFKLKEGGGLELIEIAPGMDVQRDVLAWMDFKPDVSENLRTMDSRIFE